MKKYYMPGEYYQLYDEKFIVDLYPLPDIQRVDLLDVDFGLWRSGVAGINELKAILPSLPSPKAIERSKKTLQNMKIINGDQLTPLGQQLCSL